MLMGKKGHTNQLLLNATTSGQKNDLIINETCAYALRGVYCKQITDRLMKCYWKTLIGKRQPNKFHIGLCNGYLNIELDNPNYLRIQLNITAKFRIIQ